MNIGDRVRLMSGREEGIVTRILDHNLVEVTIDDFPVPVLRSELVVIAAEEFKAFGGSQLAPSQVPAKPAPAKGGKAKPTTSPTQTNAAPAPGASSPKETKPTPPAPKGLYLALLPQTSELLALHLINNTDAEVLFTFGEERANGQYRGLASGKIEPKTASQPLGHRHLKDFEQWPAAVVQLLPSQPNSAVLYDVLLKRVSFKANTFYSSRREAPIVQREAYLFQLDEKPAAAIPVPTTDEPAPAAVPTVDPIKLRDQLAEKLRGDAKSVVPAPKQEPVKAIAPPSHEVDLHLEVLKPEGAEGMTNTAILELQINVFEDTLSRALATGMHEIIFIHGTGNGTLRKELHKRLSRNRDIKFFEEARKEKFGYGATLVRLK